jgi:hypothetical protein
MKTSRDPAAQFKEKQQLVALFRAQLDLLRAADPAGDDGPFRQVNLEQYDRLLAEGPGARWPAGMLSGLKQGIRDAQIMLDLAYPGPGRVEVRRKLRDAGGESAEVLEAQDSRHLATVRRRGQIRNEDEYYVVVAAIDRLETQSTPDDALLSELRRLVESTRASRRHPT